MSTQTPWNSDYDQAKGSILVGNGTRPIVRTIGIDGQVLTANSAQADGVEWQTPPGSISFTQIVQQVFNASGTYTPTAGMSYCIIEMVGAGGAGGGASATGAGQYSVGGGGGAGSYSRGVFDAATIGASQVVTVGIGGTGVAGGTGNSGGNTSVGALISSSGGAGGANTTGSGATGRYGRGGGSGTGAIDGNAIRSSRGLLGFQVGTIVFSGNGGSSIWGQGGEGGTTSVSQIGNNASGRGGGGGGSGNGPSQAAIVGGDGTDGLVVITEFIV